MVISNIHSEYNLQFKYDVNLLDNVSTRLLNENYHAFIQIILLQFAKCVVSKAYQTSKKYCLSLINSCLDVNLGAPSERFQ